MHFFATCMVCLGAHFSAIWIVVANSWMQTPAGYQIVGEGWAARAEITDFWAMVFNPSAMERLSHVLCGAWQAGAFLVVSVSAFYLLRRRHEEFARASLKAGLAVGLAASLLQILTGHDSAVGVSRNQPVKLAAFEGHFDSGPRAPLHLFGWVDEAQEQVVGGPALPGGLSFLVHGDPNSRSPACAKRRRIRRIVRRSSSAFKTFHGMVGIGFFMVTLSLLGAFYWWRGRLFSTRWLCGCWSSPWPALNWPTSWGGSPPNWAANPGSSKAACAHRKGSPRSFRPKPCLPPWFFSPSSTCSSGLSSSTS